MYNLPPVYQSTAEKEVAPGVFTTKIHGLLYLKHNTFIDKRGFFSELAKIPKIETIIGKPYITKQVNHARSHNRVVRGIHAENWTKIVQVINGLCFSAIADVRPESPTFLKVEYFVFGQGEDAMDGSLYIPPRLGNTVCVLEGPVDYVYLFDVMYEERDTSGDVSISLFDPDLNIQWPIPQEEMIISERDKVSVTLREKYPEKFT